MVEKEIWMRLLAPRGDGRSGAGARPPRGVSFTGAWQTMMAFGESLGQASSGRRERLVAAMLKAIAGHRSGGSAGAGRAPRHQAEAQEAPVSPKP
jgi:hypothetical protein